MCILYKRITDLCKQKGVSGSRMCLDLGLSKSTMSDMKSGRKKGLNASTAQKIANYFGVSVGYLLGEEEKKSSDINIVEHKEHKNIFAENLKLKMQENDKTRKDICDALNLSYFTVTDWVNAKKMPRMDKIEKLANYFGCLKSDLIEEKTDEQKKNDIRADIILKMRSDETFMSVVESLSKLDDEKLKSIQQMLIALLK